MNYFTSLNVTCKEMVFYFKYLSDFYWLFVNRGRHGRDRMVVRFTTTCAISAYHH